MADIKSILGDAYKENMTIDEINAALASRELLDKSELSKYVPKDKADKYATEAADWKRKHNALLSDEEKRKAEREESDAKLKTDYDALLKETTTAKHKAKFLALGYDENLAEQTAAALVGGDTETVFKNQSVFIANRDKAMKAELLKDTPRPPAAPGSGGIDFTKEAETAMLAGDTTKAAYYTRMAAQEKKE